ncbi:hypothetical protein FRC03_006438 [Tulasnella sp. 419]|nr:hypothetical protein FRC02_006563 [Tulasnella sp. 418]KAG8968691.1 hypothetical protein FRC03_006438 [Tulasnella sp. 419]
MTDEQHQQFSLIQSHEGHDSPIAPRVVSQPGYSLTKVENADDMLLIGESGPLPVLPRNFRTKKRNRVMQSCVACHSQKRKCDRKRPCTRCTEHGIAGQCVYQLEDPVLREGPEQDELLRLRGRVADLEHTVRVLMQKPLSKRAAAALEAETDAILGTTSTRKRKVDKDATQDRATKVIKTGTKSHDQEDLAEWLPVSDAALPSPVDSTSAFSPYATTPADSFYLPSYTFGDGITPPCDVPTPPYSTFPTPSSDADSPFRYTMESFGRRYSDGGTLANMLSHGMSVQSPAFSAASPASPAPAMSMHNHSSASTNLNCGCGSNPIGSEVLQGMETNIDVAIDVLKALPDHQHGNHCNLLERLVEALDMIRTATNASSASAIAASPTFPPSSAMPPPPPPQAAQPVMAPSPAYVSPAPSHPVSHVSPASEPGVSPHSTVASPPNYLLHNPRNASSFHHTDVPTVSGFSSLGSWASFRGSTTYPVQSPLPYAGSSVAPHHPHPPQRSRSSSLVVYGQEQR